VSVGMAALVSTAGASQVVSDHARLDGSIGKAATQSAINASASRAVNEPRDPYTEGA